MKIEKPNENQECNSQRCRCYDLHLLKLEKFSDILGLSNNNNISGTSQRNPNDANPNKKLKIAKRDKLKIFWKINILNKSLEKLKPSTCSKDFVDQLVHEGLSDLWQVRIYSYENYFSVRHCCFSMCVRCLFSRCGVSLSVFMKIK